MLLNLIKIINGPTSLDHRPGVMAIHSPNVRSNEFYIDLSIRNL